MSFYGWKPYVPVAKRRAQAEKAAAKAAKGGAALTPVRAQGNQLASTFWGRAWCDNLERYSDFSNRLPRGRTYLRNGSVIDLKIEGGEVKAKVSGSSLYTTVVKVAAVPAAHWRELSRECAGSIDSVVELLRGQLSQAVMARICKPGTGLFPAPREISFDCSCPDWASMCKHVAAVLYGVGVRLDEKPELLFRLRNVDAADLVAQAGAGLTPQKRPAAGRVLDDAQLADVFGIDIAEVQAVAAAPGKRAAVKKAKPAVVKAAKPAVVKAAKPAVVKAAKPAVVKKAKPAATRTPDPKTATAAVPARRKPSAAPAVAALAKMAASKATTTLAETTAVRSAQGAALKTRRATSAAPAKPTAAPRKTALRKAAAQRASVSLEKNSPAKLAQVRSRKV